MKIEGPGQSTATSGGKKSGKADRKGNIFSGFMTDDVAETTGTRATQSIAMVDALLAIQGAEDPAQGAARKRMRLRSETLLDEMDRLRVALLSGGLTVGHMIDLADTVASHREKISDPALTAIMDEIDLRAQVELAKLRVVLDRGSA